MVCMRAQISKARADVNVTERDLLQIPTGPRTEACLRNNCVVGVQVLQLRFACLLCGSAALCEKGRLCPSEHGPLLTFCA